VTDIDVTEDVFENVNVSVPEYVLELSSDAETRTPFDGAVVVVVDVVVVVVDVDVVVDVGMGDVDVVVGVEPLAFAPAHALAEL
jgi:hypothetical protein